MVYESEMNILRVGAGDFGKIRQWHSAETAKTGFFGFGSNHEGIIFCF